MGQVGKVFVRSLNSFLGSVMALKGKRKTVMSPSHLAFGSTILFAVLDRGSGEYGRKFGRQLQ